MDLAELVYGLAGSLEMNEHKKAAMLAAVVALAEHDVEPRRALNDLENVCYDEDWSWSECEDYLQFVYGCVDTRDMMLELYRWAVFAKHKLMRKTQIKEALNGRKVVVFCDGEAPCGAISGESFTPDWSDDECLLPCLRLACCCSWVVDVSGRRNG